jgi:hypothetical protein
LVDATHPKKHTGYLSLITLARQRTLVCSFAVAIAAVGLDARAFLTGQQNAGRLPCFAADNVYAGASVHRGCAY